MKIMKKCILPIAIYFFFYNLMACNSNYYNEDRSICTWLGQKSSFSKAYKRAKCILDETLNGLPLEQKRLVANLIAQSYDACIIAEDETLPFNY
tara:strand:+ start:529 stop:810 length:282 start_codon:yes stop_codon:yes gene_type:complete